MIQPVGTIVTSPSPGRRSFAFVCGVAVLGLALEVVEHGSWGFVCGGPPKAELTQHLVEARQFDWLRASIERGDDGCGRPAAWVTHDARDAWDGELLFLCTAGRPLVISAGEDGLFGTADDLRTDRRFRAW